MPEATEDWKPKDVIQAADGELGIIIQINANGGGIIEWQGMGSLKRRQFNYRTFQSVNACYAAKKYEKTKNWCIK